jgi:PAS domain S-box-containing protein
MATYFIGIIRFNLLRTTPIALRTVLDKISDLYVVIDEGAHILDYNSPFAEVFGEYAEIRKGMNIHRAISGSKIGIVAENFDNAIEYCRDSGAIFSMEFKVLSKGRSKYYNVEFTPLIIENVYCGIILLLRDITQAKHDIEELKSSQVKLIERERLASLGQLMGGIAHNLKTPLLAIAGRVESLNALTAEYEKSIGIATVTHADHAEIAAEMRQEVSKIKNHISYISDIISAIKAQTVKSSNEQRESFTIGELIRRVGILLQHELISKNCKLSVELLADEKLTLGGDVVSLIQVLDNIIINAIHAYKGTKGVIILKIWNNDRRELCISIADNAGGISQEVQDKLFRQMITTKGTDGTGLGLYISYATVVGMFDGKITFTSVENHGTEFTITLPLG